MAIFAFVPRIEQVYAYLGERLDRLRGDWENPQDFSDVDGLVAILADRDRQLEDWLSRFQVGDGPPLHQAKPGTVYLNRLGGAGTTEYLKETAESSVVWRAI